jgi:hypothetical protein
MYFQPLCIAGGYQTLVSQITNDPEGHGHGWSVS